MKELSKMSVEELLQLQTEVQKAVAEKKQEKRQELRLLFKELAEKEGMNVEEIMNINPAKEKRGKRGPAPVKYRKGENTWSGRGRTPGWAVDVIHEEGTLAAYLVED